MTIYAKFKCQITWTNAANVATVAVTVTIRQMNETKFNDNNGLSISAIDGQDRHTQEESSSPLDSNDFVKGCPPLLVPFNDNWAPTERDKQAPPVLPSRTFIGKVRTAFSRKAGKPLRPTPMSFLREAPPPSKEGPTYSSFQAFYIPGKHKKQIANGFEPRYPADVMVDHDVSAVDWDRFLVNLRVAGALRGYDHLIANLIPAPLHLVYAGYGNFWITKAIMSGLQRRYIPEVLALVEAYQYRFFQPRRLDVFVACGTSRLSGYFPGDDSYLHAPPVETGLRIDESESESSSSSSGSSSESSDSEADEYLRRVPRKDRKALKSSRSASQIPSKKKLAKLDPVTRAQMEAKLSQQKSDRERILQQRRKELEEEEKAGMRIKKHGKYRIVVQPMCGSPVVPTKEWARRLMKREKSWGLRNAIEENERMGGPDPTLDSPGRGEKAGPSCSSSKNFDSHQ